MNAHPWMSTQRPAAQSFRDLVVWRKAHELVLAVYRLTESFPDREKFGLSHQMRHHSGQHRRSFAKRSRADKARTGPQFLCFVLGAHDVLAAMLEEVNRLLNAYARAILASGS